MDGTPRLSRDGEPVYHYSLPLDVRRAPASCPSARASRSPTTCRSTSPRSSAAPSRPASAPSGARPGVRPGDRVAMFGCGGVGLSALMAAVAVGAEPVIAVDAAPQKLDVARDVRRDGRGRLGRGAQRRPPRPCARRRGGGVDYAIEATGRPRGDAGRVPLDAHAWRGRAHRHPARGRDAVPARRHDPADGAPHPRLDLRLGEARAGLPAHARPLPRGPPAARPPHLAPAAARGGRARRSSSCTRETRSASCSN